MIQKMFDSSRSGMTRSSSHVASIYDNDFLELVLENGEIVVRGGSSNRSRKTNEERIHDEDASINKRTRLNPLLEDHFPPQRDSDMSSSHQSKLHEEFENLLKPVSIGNNHLQQCLPSSPLKKQRTVDSTQTPPTPKLNFSNFSIPAVFLKSTTHQGNSATQQTKNHSSPARMEEIIEARKVEQSAKESHGFHKQTSLTIERSTKLPTPPVDEHSEAVGHNCGVLGIHRSQGQLRCDQTSTSEALIKAKAKAYNNNTTTCHEPLLASSSVCSLGASNDPNLGLRKHEDNHDSTYLSDNDGEPEDMVKQDRDGNRVRRIRNPVVHNLSEKKRREKINKKMRTLKELIPNCNKVDKASMLDDAIDYLKTLKLQLQIMSMGNGLWPLMMLPAATTAHHMNPQLGIGFRPPQLPIPPPLSAITDNRLQMFGCFPNQIPPMPAMPHAPFFPIIANSATQPHLANTTNLAEHLAASLYGNATKLAPPSQVSFQHHRCTSTPTLATPFNFPQK